MNNKDFTPKRSAEDYLGHYKEPEKKDSFAVFQKFVKAAERAAKLGGY